MENIIYKYTDMFGTVYYFNSKKAIDMVGKPKYKNLWDQYLHRLDGPAQQLHLGNKSYYNYYYINGDLYKSTHFWQHPEVIRYNYLKLWE